MVPGITGGSGYLCFLTTDMPCLRSSVLGSLASVCSFQSSGQEPPPPKTHPWWLLVVCLSPASEIIQFVLPIHHAFTVFDIGGVNTSVLERAPPERKCQIQVKYRVRPSLAARTWVSKRVSVLVLSLQNRTHICPGPVTRLMGDKLTLKSAVLNP